MNEFVAQVPTSGGAMGVHCFLPEGAEKRATVILLQEAFGVNEHIKGVCRRVAGLGYAVFSPELFHRSGEGLAFGYDEFPRIKPILGAMTNEQVAEDLRATQAHVAGLPGIDPGRMACWGFCMGGWAAVLAACELRLAATVSFYGGGLVHPRPGIGFGPLIDRLRDVRCPLLLVFGGKDQGIPPSDIAAVDERLKALGKPHEIEIYADGGHGFFCDARPAYHRVSAEAAWDRATKWLGATLKV